MRGEQAANYLRSPTKYDANTPLGVGTDSSCPYISVINSVGDCHHFVGGLFIVCGGFCICGRDKSVPYSCEQIAITLLTDCDNAWRTHTVRRTDCKYAWGNE